MASSSYSRFNFNHSISQQQPQNQGHQTNPFLLHQQRQFFQQQHNFNSDQLSSHSWDAGENEHGIPDHGQRESVIPLSSSSSSPITYFFNKAASTFLSTESPLQFIGDGVKDSDYNYFLLNAPASIPPSDDGIGNDFSELTTLQPDNFTSTTELPNPLNIWWHVFDQQYLRHNLGWTITLVIAYTLILIIGIIGNCMVILVVVFRPQMRTVTNMFIMNLAVADLFVIAFCVPGTLLANVFAPWILGSFMCKGVAYVQGVSVCASAYSLAAISLDRCKAIYRPMERPRGLSKSQALFTICLIWVVALLMTIPWAVIFSVVQSKMDGLSYCVETWENERHGKIYFLVVNLICCYSLPLILISISNVVIWCHVSHRKVPQDSASAGTIKRMHRRTRHGVRKMLGIVTLAFLISWLPLYILVTRIKFSTVSEEEANILDILMPFAQWLGSWNSSINPVLYAFLNSKFRESFKSLLPAWVPFVHHNSSNLRIMRNNVGRGTVTNGTFTGTQGTPSYTTVFTARSSARCGSSKTNSRRFRGSSAGSSAKNSGKSNRRTLLVSSFRGGEVAATTTVPTTTTTVTTQIPAQVPTPPPTAIVPATTVSALVGGAAAAGGGNGGAVIMTTTLMMSTATPSTTAQTAIITDL